MDKNKPSTKRSDLDRLNPKVDDNLMTGFSFFNRGLFSNTFMDKADKHENKSFTEIILYYALLIGIGILLFKFLSTANFVSSYYKNDTIGVLILLLSIVLVSFVLTKVIMYCIKKDY